MPIDTLLRLLYLKHRYGLGYESLCREVSDSIGWRRFCRIGLDRPVPPPTTLIKLVGRAGPEVVQERLGSGDAGGAGGRGARLRGVPPNWPKAGCAPSSPSCARRCGAGLVAHHALLVRLAVAHLEQLEASIAELDTHIDRVIAPFAQARDRLDIITGVGRRAAECMIGRDRGGHLGVPHRLTPGLVGALAAGATTPTGGKRRSGKPTKGNRWLGEVLTRVRRIGKKKAAVAVGHSILVIAWHLLANDCDYADLGGDYFTRRDTDRQRQRAVAQLQALGYRVVLEPVAA